MSRLLKFVFMSAVVPALWLMTASPAPAGPITVFNTGVDASGTPLPDGTLGDPHYTLIAYANRSTSAIRVHWQSGSNPIRSWIGDDPVSAWIGPNNSPSLSSPFGAYEYQTTFTLPSDGTVTLSGQWANDDEGGGISLDGAPLTTPTPSSFTNFTPFTLTGLGHSGLNTIVFLVYNTNDDTPTGLRVEFTSANFTPSGTAVPEPASLTLLGIGLAVMGGFTLRRRQTAAV